MFLISLQVDEFLSPEGELLFRGIIRRITRKPCIEENGTDPSLSPPPFISTILWRWSPHAAQTSPRARSSACTRSRKPSERYCTTAPLFSLSLSVMHTLFSTSLPICFSLIVPLAGLLWQGEAVPAQADRRARRHQDAAQEAVREALRMLPLPSGHIPTHTHTLCLYVFSEPHVPRSCRSRRGRWRS